MFIDLLRSRRSVRQYRDKPVEKEKIDLLIEAALRAPSSRGFNPWEFVVIDDPETLAALSRTKHHGASFLDKAPLAIAVCGDPEKPAVRVEDVPGFQADQLGRVSRRPICWGCATGWRCPPSWPSDIRTGSRPPIRNRRCSTIKSVSTAMAANGHSICCQCKRGRR